MLKNRLPEIESSETIKGIVNVFSTVNRELEIENQRKKRFFLEKYNLNELKVNSPKTALEACRY